MSDPFRKWAQGDEWEPSAAQLNTWTDAARLVQQSLNTIKPADSQQFQPFTPVRMQNNTGAEIPQLGVVTYTTPLVLPSANEHRFVYDTTLVAIKPAAPLDRFAIALERVQTDGVFWAVCGGVVPCKVTGTGTKVEAINNDIDKLQAGSSGFELIWSESGSSTRFGIVKLFGAGGSCSKKYQLFVLWSPGGGSFKLRVRAKDGGGAWVAEDVVIAWNASATNVKDAIEGHSLITAGTVTVSASGSFPTNNMNITMPTNTELGDGSVSAFQDGSNSLTATGLTVPALALWDCCS